MYHCVGMYSIVGMFVHPDVSTHDCVGLGVLEDRNECKTVIIIDTLNYKQ